MKFVGGYYVELLDMEFKGLAFTEILNLNLEEALQHPAIENVKESIYAEDYYSEDFEDAEEEFDKLSDNIKMKIIENYILGDEIFGGAFYSEEKALEIIKELEENKKEYK